eukprot:CAMPEP_0172483064 /NCGR_PEP_ID=MMETSP1066-20121228/9874_1 /TAXON_ID=671091 /ORGANISM="Coscinodiscus wailesii, Strain CCMP2513" /LENGTH=46 /DNA_ID= /DNA_START= /DNA_END= /DNA_ORIENTATION=
MTKSSSSPRIVPRSNDDAEYSDSSGNAAAKPTDECPLQTATLFDIM